MRRLKQRWTAASTAMVVVAFALSIAVISAGAQSTTVSAGNLVLTFHTEVSPKALSKTELTPISFELGTKVVARDGGHPPAAETFNGEIDKNGALNTKGLAACRMGQLEARRSDEAKQVCKNSLVGEGTAEAKVEFAEQAPFDAKGPLLVFNGGTRGGKTLLLAHVYASVPAPTAFVTPIHVTRINHGKYGLKFEATIPIIAGGNGSLSSLSVKNKKIFTYKGKKQSYFLAKCPAGLLFGKGNLSFSDGTRLIGTVSEPCTPKS